jgi:hypothetical protein
MLVGTLPALLHTHHHVEELSGTRETIKRARHDDVTPSRFFNHTIFHPPAHLSNLFANIHRTSSTRFISIHPRSREGAAKGVQSWMFTAFAPSPPLSHMNVCVRRRKTSSADERVKKPVKNPSLSTTTRHNRKAVVEDDGIWWLTRRLMATRRPQASQSPPTASTTATPSPWRITQALPEKSEGRGTSTRKKGHQSDATSSWKSKREEDLETRRLPPLNHYSGLKRTK